MPPRPQRVLYIQRPRGGGSAASLHALVRSLDRRRVEPLVLFYDAASETERFRAIGAQVLTLQEASGERRGAAATAPAGSGLRQLSRLIRREWPLARRLASLIREQRIDLVHHNNNPVGNRASILAARLAGVRQVCHVRFLPDYYRPIDLPLSHVVDEYLFVSAAVERQCRTELRLDPGKGRVVENSLDLGPLAEAARARCRLRNELRIGNDAFLVACVGRLVAWKGQDHFLRAVARLVTLCPGLRALIVGAADDRPGSAAFAHHLRVLAQELGLADQVVFTGFRADVPEVMAASDVVVHSSAEPEPFGRVIIEAMAVGRPVVATAAGGPLEIITPEETGLLVPPRDPAGMAAAILRLYEHPELARRLGERARLSVRERFSPERHAEVIHAVYDRLLGRRTH